MAVRGMKAVESVGACTHSIIISLQSLRLRRSRPRKDTGHLMISGRTLVLVSALCGTAFFGARATREAEAPSLQRSAADDLRALFADWRTFQRPKLADGVPDYSANAMAAQHRELPAYERRLTALDARGWPVGQQVDWHIVRAEMDGLDFDHRVLRPWANNPAFYVTVFADQSDQAAREGP